jgi:hypothetical protein
MRRSRPSGSAKASQFLLVTAPETLSTKQQTHHGLEQHKHLQGLCKLVALPRHLHSCSY